MNKKIVVIDVDDTLWNMSEILYKELKVKFPDVEEPSKWNTWEFYTKYSISEKDFYEVVDKIHREQELYTPYKYASLLSSLLRLTHHVIIASHRKPEYKKYLKKWLDKHDIMYDELFVDYCKYDLFDNADLVIDDSPVMIMEAAKRGSKFICGLKSANNEELKNTFLLCENLKELIICLSRQEIIKI